MGYLYPLLKGLGRIRQNEVRIEGGLGSQIMGLITGLYLSSKGEDVRFDVSYFAPKRHAPKVMRSGLVLWPWALSEYGYSSEELSSKKPPFTQPMSPSDRTKFNVELWAEMLDSGWLISLPIPESVFPKITALGLDKGEDYGVVHLRRGDYVAAGSRIISVSDVLGLLSDVKTLVPPKILFVSDSPFTHVEESKIRETLTNFELLFYVGQDPHTTHAIMRLASFLVTSNSTFSWTAALLNEQKNRVCITPGHFFQPRLSDTNRIYESSAAWTIMGKGLQERAGTN